VKNQYTYPESPTRKKVRVMRADGKGASAIALACNISLQRVYQHFAALDRDSARKGGAA